jgi:hypothetical protein
LPKTFLGATHEGTGPFYSILIYRSCKPRIACGEFPRCKRKISQGKPIRIIVGLSAGGATDVMARLVAAKMSETLNTPVTVENKTGGNFNPGPA